MSTTTEVEGYDSRGERSCGSSPCPHTVLNGFYLFRKVGLIMFPEGTNIEDLSRALLEFYPRIEGQIEDLKECVDTCVKRGFYEKCAEASTPSRRTF